MVLLADKSDEEITTLFTGRDISGFPEGPEALLERAMRSVLKAPLAPRKAGDIHQTIASPSIPIP
ncbi:hypothetical protein [Pseudovibrio ascidiaceicola]|uniref:hypothetical protein n=1 Tax=Pseudovibrio ascidiaceicola TaxID=285279 RepID=UPI001AD930FF|nr:hypothetical protein [Pseudovibrio ascidiaceicola]